MKRVFSIAAASLVFAVVGCASKHEEGVRSDYRSQWTDVAANTTTTTEAARTVLTERGLKDVTADSTNVDGMAKAKQADGTKITVNVKKETATTSQVSVTVGTLGDPKLGADIAAQTKRIAEGGAGTMVAPVR